MKRFISLVLIIGMCFGLMSCGKEQKESKSERVPSSEASERVSSSTENITYSDNIIIYFPDENTMMVKIKASEVLDEKYPHMCAVTEEEDDPGLWKERFNFWSFADSDNTRYLSGAFTFSDSGEMFTSNIENTRKDGDYFEFEVKAGVTALIDGREQGNSNPAFRIEQLRELGPIKIYKQSSEGKIGGEYYIKPIIFWDSENVDEYDGNGNYSDNSLTKEDVEALIYLNDTDREFLTPTTDDYLMIYVDMPEVTVFPYWGIENINGSWVYMGWSEGSENLEKPAQYVEVISYDSAGNVETQRQSLRLEERNDALRLMCTEKLCSYWFQEETGINEVPSDFDGFETTIYCVDEKLPKELENKMTLFREENVFYASPKDPYEGNFFFTQNVAFLTPPAQYYDSRTVNRLGVGQMDAEYSFEQDNDVLRFIKTRGAKVTYYYSMPSKHSSHYLCGKGEPFSGDFPAIIRDMYFPEEFDDAYFRPTSDDYILFYLEPDEEPDRNKMAVLISFDDRGNEESVMLRVTHPDWYEVDMEFDKSDFEQMGGTTLYTDNDTVLYMSMPTIHQNKYEVLTSSFFPINCIDCPYFGSSSDSRAYISNPYLLQEKEIPGMMEFDEEKYFVDVKKLSDDYYVYDYNDDGVTNIYDENGDLQKIDVNAIYEVWFYDEFGSRIQNMIYNGADEKMHDVATQRIIEFVNEEDAKKYVDLFNLRHWDLYSIRRTGNIVTTDDVDIEDETFLSGSKQDMYNDLMYGIIYDDTDSFSNTYLSIPYLTDKQYEILIDKGWHMTRKDN